MKPYTCPRCNRTRLFIDHPSVHAWCPCRPRQRTPMTPIDRQPTDDNQGKPQAKAETQ